MKKPNQLIHETSPYLLQHAHNPVNWFPWGEAALKKAVEEDKMMLISIGYSSCHWCHVMEHESFEDEQVADIMNKFFVCIKVDREERPDIDQVYMTAVQLMTGRGGWPLNCFTLPDGRPVYGGTYFPKSQWMNILINLAEGYKKDKSRFLDYAEQLTQGLQMYDLIPSEDTVQELKHELIATAVTNWKKSFDNTEGGPNRAPKFPLPNNYYFLLKYNSIYPDNELNDHIKLTLKKMAFGGIYDQVGGGFARYSVDGIWKVPHFEKMLYDNAQLVTLYSEAFKTFKDPVYKHVVYQTLEFITRELTGPQNNFYSALDADSEGVEGKFYTWKKDELEKILGDDFSFFAKIFNVNEKGYWEHEMYILLRDKSDEELIQELGMQETEFKNKLEHCIQTVLLERAKRIRPGLDDKTLLSWNALMTCGFLDSYDAFGEVTWLEKAEQNIRFALENMTTNQGGLLHNYKNGKSTINGFLEDYAFFIQALIRMYQVTFEIEYLHKAKEFTEFVNIHFSDADNELFFFTADFDARLITRSKEVQDNVIPASNSQMAINLYYLGHYFENGQWMQKSVAMLQSVVPHLVKYSSSYSNWLLLYLFHTKPLHELVICGPATILHRNEIARYPLPPGIILAGSTSEENLPLTRNRMAENETKIYPCVDKQCYLPVLSPQEAIKLIS